MVAAATAPHHNEIVMPRAKEQSLLCLVRLLQPACRNLASSAWHFVDRYRFSTTERLEVLARLGRAMLLVLHQSFQRIGKLGALAELEMRMRSGRHRAEIDVKERQVRPQRAPHCERGVKYAFVGI